MLDREGRAQSRGTSNGGRHVFSLPQRYCGEGAGDVVERMLVLPCRVHASCGGALADKLFDGFLCRTGLRHDSARCQGLRLGGGQGGHGEPSIFLHGGRTCG